MNSSGTGSGGVGRLVKQSPPCVLVSHPIIVGIEVWMCFRAAELWGLGKVARKSLSMALQSVLVGV